jgi:hypothetical protein
MNSQMQVCLELDCIEKAGRGDFAPMLQRACRGKLHFVKAGSVKDDEVSNQS